MDMFKDWNRGDYQKKLWNGAHQGEENKVDLNLTGRKGLEQCLSTVGPLVSVPDPGINYTGPREVLLEFVILVFLSNFH